jgi:hypothetical protein
MTDRVARNRFLLEFFAFPLSVSCHKFFVIFTFKATRKGQMGETWEPSNKSDAVAFFLSLKGVKIT